MHVDVLVAEIGSTTTVINVFDRIGSGNPEFIGQGQAPTSVLEGDVTVGLSGAIDDFKRKMEIDELKYDDMLATSSAAGGLKMTVHGLVYDMTVRAAKEAALGAGGIIKMVTAGKMRRTDLRKIKEIEPNIILIAGGVDYGERDTALYNLELVLSMGLKTPIIYAGNIENQEEVKLLCEEADVKLYLVENVYPKIDTLVIEPTRKVIQEAFEEHIIHAAGMQKVRELVNGPIIPTPGAVMETAKVLKNELGDLVIFDVGGATTDVHSVTEGTEEVSNILISPEPIAKRTVEGDLGVYVNANHVIDRITEEKLREEFEDFDELMANYKPIPITDREKEFVERLTLEAVETSLDRHAGKYRSLYAATGKKTVAEGKDLTAIKYIIGTGGALTRLPKREYILGKVKHDKATDKLYPGIHAKLLIDNDYIFASLGVLSKRYLDDAVLLMKKSLGMKNMEEICIQE